MSLNNLSSFHFNRILQNATAFPAHIYQSTCNSLGVNSLAERYLKQTQADKKKKSNKTPPPIHRIPTPKTAEIYQESPFPSQRKPLTIEGNAVLKREANKATPPIKSDPVIPASQNRQSRFPEINISKILTERIQAEEARIVEQLSAPKLPQPTKAKSAHIITPGSEQKEQQSTNLAKTKLRIQDTVLAGRKMIWRSGHGAIERVDKLTGEIVHLAEDYNKPLLAR